MKKSILFVLILISSPFALKAQTMTMSPDSGYQGQSLPVTIVGIGTHFSNTNNASSVQVLLERYGAPVGGGYYSHLVNDSTINTTIEVGATMLGSYDLVVEVTDTALHTYRQDSAFYVTLAPASITSVSPSSAYDSQTVSLEIGGQGTTFESGPSPTISFQLNGTTFTAQLDSIYSNTSISATLTVPSGAVAGVYDVIVQNGTYSDTGKRLFTVLGPIPTVVLVPDTGAASTIFDVSVVGQNTNFAATSNASLPIVMDIFLKQSGITYYHTTADTVFSATLADAVFTLPDSLPQGDYDAEISGNTNTGSSYDLHTAFSIMPHITIQLPFKYSAAPADTVTVGVTGSRVNFIYDGTQYAKIVRLVYGKYSITAQSVTVINDTSLVAFFSIPDTAPPGIYDVQVVEPGTNRIVVGPQKFTVNAPSAVTDIASYPEIIDAISVSPNPSYDLARISFTVSQPIHVRLILYDALGRTVATLCDRMLGSGVQEFEWPVTNTPSGSYFYELTAGDELHGGRVVLQH